MSYVIRLILILFSLTQAAEALNEHPRILLTPDIVARLKAKAAANDPDWISVKRFADQYAAATVQPFSISACPVTQICYGGDGSGWYFPVLRLGLAWQVTGDVKYANKLKQLLVAMNDTAKAGNPRPIYLSLPCQSGGYATRFVGFGIGLAYDWIYSQLTPALKTDTIATINYWFKQISTCSYNRLGTAYGNFFGGHLLFYGSVGYATEGDNPNAQAIIDYAANLYDTVIRPAFVSGGYQGGFVQEGYSYGAPHLARLLQYAKIVETATGTPLDDAHGNADVLARNLIYALMPNRWRVPAWGTNAGDCVGILNKILPLVLSDVLEGSTSGAWMQSLLAAMPPGLCAGAQRPLDFDGFLYYSSARPSRDYRIDSPLSYLSPGDGHVFIRSDWSDAATWASFAASPKWWEASHNNRVAGNLSIIRGDDYLLPYVGEWAGTNGIAGSPSRSTWLSNRANTLDFCDKGEYLAACIGTYAGGQQFYGLPLEPVVQSGGPGITYVKANLTSAYERRNPNPALRSLTLWERSIVSIENRYFVVFDRVESRKDTYEKKLLWHFSPAAALTITGNRITEVLGNSQLFIDVVLPQESTIVQGVDQVSETNTTMVTKKIEVSNSLPLSKLTALQVIGVSGLGAFPPATSPVGTQDDLWTGVVIRDLNGPVVVVFSKDGAQYQVFR